MLNFTAPNHGDKKIFDDGRRKRFGVVETRSNASDAFWPARYVRARGKRERGSYDVINHERVSNLNAMPLSHGIRVSR